MRGKHARRSTRRRERQAAQRAAVEAEQQKELRMRLQRAKELEARSSARVLRTMDALESIHPAELEREESFVAASEVEATVKHVRRLFNRLGRAFWRDWDEVQRASQRGQRDLVMGTTESLDLIQEMIEAGLMPASRMTDNARQKFKGGQS